LQTNNKIIQPCETFNELPEQQSYDQTNKSRSKSPKKDVIFHRPKYSHVIDDYNGNFQNQAPLTSKKDNQQYGGDLAKTLNLSSVTTPYNDP